MSETRKSDRYNIRVVDKAVRVLNVLSDGNPRTLTMLSKEMDINSSTTFRLLATLLSHNLVELDQSTGKYRLGLACLELSRAYHTENEMRRAALPEMEKLRDDTMETVHLGILTDNEIVYLEKLESLHAIGMMSSRVGGRAPAYCTGLGKAMLAHASPGKIQKSLENPKLQRFTEATIVNRQELVKHLQQIRQIGYALDKGEHEREVRCVAAPIFDQNGKTVAAISVSGPKDRFDPVEDNQDLIERTKRAACNISKRLGYREENI
ncbi:IclR family transcriptional regulator [Chloroflexota bacterium]